MLNEQKVREHIGETAQILKRAGMDPRRAESVAQKFGEHAARKANGESVPERFRPISDSRLKK